MFYFFCAAAQESFRANVKGREGFVTGLNVQISDV